MTKHVSVREPLKLAFDMHEAHLAEVLSGGRDKFRSGAGWGALLDLARQVDERAKVIGADQNLSERGKSQGLVGILREGRSSAVSWRNETLARYDRDITAAIASLKRSTSPEPADPIERLMLLLKRQEIRRGLERLDPL